MYDLLAFKSFFKEKSCLQKENETMKRRQFQELKQKLHAKPRRKIEARYRIFFWDHEPSMEFDPRIYITCMSVGICRFAGISVGSYINKRILLQEQARG